MNWKRLIGWPWFRKEVKREAMETGWENDDWYLSAAAFRERHAESDKSAKLAYLAHVRGVLIDQLAKAKAQKKARKHIYAALEENTRERLLTEADAFMQGRGK